MPAIQLRNVTKRFGDVTALWDLSLTVEEGEIFGFLGPNGAGKSTTIDILLDFVRPTDGEASVLGMDAQTDSLAVRKRTGILPDGYHVYDRLTGRQHVELAIESKGSGEAPDALLERVGILEAADRKAGGYSKGMKQRLVLAMALVGDPDLLVLDEPTTGLDPNGAREMREIIREERDRGATVFFSSHILEQVEAVCDRVAIIDEGRLVTVDTIDGLRASMGDGVRLVVTVDRVPEGAVADLEALAGVRGVDAADTVLSVHLDADGSKAAVLNAVEAQGATVLDFDTEQSSLEDLFVAFTRHDDGGATGADADAGGMEVAR
jgi:ABC-2 type transport system ATP-binding protein